MLGLLMERGIKSAATGGGGAVHSAERKFGQSKPRMTFSCHASRITRCVACAIGVRMSDLSFATLREFDSEPYDRGDLSRFCCPFCGADKPRDNAHRSLTVTVAGIYHCFRCDERGVLKEFRQHARVSAMQHAYHKRMGAVPTRTAGIFE